MPKFYINTPIYYVNDRPHIGHAYTTIVADALARFHRLKDGKESVRFVTGTDENSQKNAQAMEKAGESDLSLYLDRMAGEWKKTWEDLDISLDDFIRTTEERHLKGVARFWEAVKKSGDIELRTYEGLYCVGCEAFKVESDLVDGTCPLHPNKPLEKLSEENYFFKLFPYRDELLKLIDSDGFVMPESRRNEIRNYVKDHLADISISREAKKLSIGIPVPGDESQRIYVWFDALLNYATAVGYGWDEELFKKWWPTDVNLVGKDIIKFHGALWPAMIMSASKHDELLRKEDGQPLIPRQVYAHGFFTMDGQKISKSLGNAIDPRDLVSTYGIDTLRYFLLREIPFGEDGDFSETRLKERYTSDLGNTFGNLVNRAIAMSKKYFDGGIPPSDAEEAREVWVGSGYLPRLVKEVVSAYQISRCDQVLECIWKDLYHANKFIEETQPFKKENEAIRAGVLYPLLEACRIYAWLLYPVMPHVTREVWTQLGLDAERELAKGWEEGTKWGGLVPGAPLGEPKPLFPRLADGKA
jgi:methionyl-tRNA synthetase